jgi:hypothetical protein
MKKAVFLMAGLLLVALTTNLSFADELKKGHRARPKHAIHELNEAKEVIAKLTPDAEGHIAKASGLIDQAIQELSAVRAEAKTPAPK